MAVTIKKTKKVKNSKSNKPVLKHPTKVLGIDPSTKMGWVFTDISTDPMTMEHGNFKFPKTKGFDRHKKIAMEVFSLVRRLQPDMVVVEGYSFGGAFNSHTQTEIGAITRLESAKACSSIIEVAPTSLKKFVTGKGNVKKDVMMLEVFKRWGFEGTDDECDAYGLSLFGQAVLDNPVDLPKSNMDAVVAWWKNNADSYCLPISFKKS